MENSKINQSPPSYYVDNYFTEPSIGHDLSDYHIIMILKKLYFLKHNSLRYKFRFYKSFELNFKFK